MPIESKQQTEIDFNTVDLYAVDLKTARIVARTVASKRLVDNKVSIYHEELGASIIFTKAGIKECVNQPFNSYIEKLILIREGLEEALCLAKYDYCPEPSDKAKEHIVCYHYFESVINGKPAFFNVQQTKKGEYVLYTITDSRRSKAK